MVDSVTATVIPGGWTDCKNDLKVQEIGKFAVDEYNKEQEKIHNFIRLKFVRVLKAKMQIVNGVIYQLFIEAKDVDVHKQYEALVYDKPDGCMELLEFYQVILGGWTGAENDVGIEDLAKFAVDEYNKKEGTTLEFTKLENAQKQIVAGILYKLTLEAIDDGHKNLYLAMVIVVPWKKIKELKDFKPLPLNVED